MTEESDRQYWNTAYGRKEDDPLIASWRRFLIERGFTPQGVMRSAGKPRMKQLIVEFLTGESK